MRIASLSRRSRSPISTRGCAVGVVRRVGLAALAAVTFAGAAAAQQAADSPVRIDEEAAKAARAEVTAALSRARMNVYTGYTFRGLGTAIRTAETGACSTETLFRHDEANYEFRHSRDWTKGGIANGKIILVDGHPEQDRYMKFDSPADEAAAVKAITELSEICNGKRQRPKDGAVKSLLIRFPTGNTHTNGYFNATAELKYRFINCMGELHVAYSLVADSVDASDGYSYNRKTLSTAGVAPPKLSAVHLNAEIFHHDVVPRKIGWLDDQAAGPALGMGCFTGQTRKIGRTAEYVDTKLGNEAVQAYLDEHFSLSNGFANTKGPLRNAAVESKTDAEWDRMGVDRALRANDANWAEADARAKAELAERKAAREQYEAAKAKYEQGMREAQAAKEKFERDKAAHEAQVARAKAAQEEYERRLAAWKAEVGDD